MKTFLKIAAVLVVVLVLAAAGGVGYLYSAYPKVPPAESITLQATPAKLERGKYLAGARPECRTSGHRASPRL